MGNILTILIIYFKYILIPIFERGGIWQLTLIRSTGFNISSQGGIAKRKLPRSWGSQSQPWPDTGTEKQNLPAVRLLPGDGDLTTSFLYNNALIAASSIRSRNSCPTGIAQVAIKQTTGGAAGIREKSLYSGTEECQAFPGRPLISSDQKAKHFHVDPLALDVKWRRL